MPLRWCSFYSWPIIIAPYTDKISTFEVNLVLLLQLVAAVSAALVISRAAVILDIMLKPNFPPAEVVSGSAIGLQVLAG